MWQISGKDKNSLVNGLGIIASQNKLCLWLYTIYASKFQMDENSKYKKLNPKSSRRKDETYFWLSMEKAFKDIIQTPEAIKKRLINLIP